MTIDQSSQESKALRIMRFPLATLIVLLHTGITCGKEDVAYYLCHYISSPIVVCAVPCFFFISGYLFFMGKEEFSPSVYRKKIKKKVKGLLIPYLIWNLIYYILTITMNYIRYRNIGEVMPWEIHKIFWAMGDGIEGVSILGYKYTIIASPSAGVLWFMRDLMMMMVCTIFMYYVVKWMKWLIFPLILIMNVLGLGVPFPGFSLAAISFFYMGAFFSIHEINVFQFLKRGNKIAYILWPMFIVTGDICGAMDLAFPEWFNIIYLASSIAFVFNLAYDLANIDKKSLATIEKWGEASFFIYACAQNQLLWLINKEPGYMIDTIPYVGHTMNYLFLFSIRIVECLLIYYTMKSYTPKVLSFLTGGRNK